MSQEETNKNFSIERKKHLDFYLPFYKNKNWIVAEDNIDGDKPISWDVKLEVFAGQYKLVDEKVLTSEWDDCLVEIIQDMRIKSWGWLFGDKDWVLYGSWAVLDAERPSSLYLVKMPELRNYIFSLKGIIKTAISHKGWGITWNIILEWSDLIELKIAQKII